MVTSDIFGLTLPAPMEETIKNLLGLINRRTMRQGTAVDANVQFLKDGSPTILEAGTIRRIGLVLDVALGAGESYSIVLQKSTNGGASYSAISDAIVVTLNEPVPAGEVLQISEMAEMVAILALTDTEVESGDILRAAIDYTAGGTPAPASGLTMFIDIAPRK